MSTVSVQNKAASGSEGRVKLGRTLPLLPTPYTPSDSSNTTSNNNNSTTTSSSRNDATESSQRASGKKKKNRKKKKGRASGSEPWGWARLPGEAFNLRVGPNYALNKRKAPSAPALYDCVSVDYFGFEQRPDYVADKLSLPPLSPELRALVPKLAELGIPTDVILNLQFPRKVTSSMFSSRCDGEGALFIVLLRIKVDTAKMCLRAAKQSQDADANTDSAADSGVPPSIRLLQRTFSKADEDPDHNLFGIFKQVARVANMDEVIHKVPTILRPLTSLNGKPRLLRTMQFRRLGDRAVEVLSGTFDSNIIMRQVRSPSSFSVSQLFLFSSCFFCPSSSGCGDGEEEEEEAMPSVFCLCPERSPCAHTLAITFGHMRMNVQAMMKYKNKMGDFVLDLAWCLEGQTDDEQPEQVLGCFQLVRADFSHASQFPYECGTPAGHGSADDCLDHTFSDLENEDEDEDEDEAGEASTATGSGSSDAGASR